MLHDVDARDGPVGSLSFLLVMVNEREYLLRLDDCLETMRPLPVEPVPQSPEFVRGLSIIRGAPVPVVDLSRLLGMPRGPSNSNTSTRWVVLAVGARRVALEVGRVEGMRHLRAPQVEALPPLLDNADPTLVVAVSALDAHLALALNAAHIVPENIWQTLDRCERE